MSGIGDLLGSDFQDNFFGDSTFSVEILVKNNSSGKLLAGGRSSVPQFFSGVLRSHQDGVAKCGTKVSHSYPNRSTLVLFVRFYLKEKFFRTRN